MNIQKNIKTVYFVVGIPLLLTVLFVVRLFIENIHAKTELPLVGYLFFSLFLLIWLSAPYILMVDFFKRDLKSDSKQTVSYTSLILVSLIGVLSLIRVRFIGSDPQGPIAILIVPLVQFAIYGFLKIITNLINRKK